LVLKNKKQIMSDKYKLTDLFIKTSTVPTAPHNRFRQEWIGPGKTYEEISKPGSFYRVHGIAEAHDPSDDLFLDKHLNYDLDKKYLRWYRLMDD